MKFELKINGTSRFTKFCPSSKSQNFSFNIRDAEINVFKDSQEDGFLLSMTDHSVKKVYLPQKEEEKVIEDRFAHVNYFDAYNNNNNRKVQYRNKSNSKFSRGYNGGYNNNIYGNKDVRTYDYSNNIKYIRKSHENKSKVQEIYDSDVFFKEEKKIRVS